MRQLLMLLLLFCLFPMTTCAEDYFSDFSLKGMIDFRTVRTDDTESWLDGGLGKTRYGGTSQGDKHSLVQIAEAVLVLSSRFSWDFSGHISLKYDPEQKHSIDILEGFVAYRPVTTSAWRFKSRLGAFFPPVSLENKGIAWTSLYSITPSAINSWIGEEVRTLGAEFTLLHENEDNRLSLTGALYKVNDPVGSLLSYRGWAMHDRKLTLNDRVPLAPIASIQPGQAFDVQAPWVEPFDEQDGRWGYYIGTNWDYLDFSNGGISKLRLLYYDNRADESMFDGNQYAWHTKFVSVGASFALDEQLEVLTQLLSGNSLMGGKIAGANPVDIDFSAFYVLVNKRYKNHSGSLRYDRFEISDEDKGILAPTDLNKEDGNAWMLAYTFKFENKQLFLFEVLKIKSDRPARALIGLPASADEIQLQVSYRFFL